MSIHDIDKPSWGLNNRRVKYKIRTLKWPLTLLPAKFKNSKIQKFKYTKIRKFNDLKNKDHNGHISWWIINAVCSVDSVWSSDWRKLSVTVRRIDGGLYENSKIQKFKFWKITVITFITVTYHEKSWIWASQSIQGDFLMRNDG